MIVYEAYPTGSEVVVANLPEGSTLRVHHPDIGTREYAAAFERSRLYIVVVADKTVLPWGCRDSQYTNLHALQLRHHKDDRPAWQEAVRLLSDQGVVYIEHKLKPYFGSERWTAAGVRVVDGSMPAYQRARRDAAKPVITWTGDREAVIAPVALCYWDRCGKCREHITSVAFNNAVRVELYVSADGETVNWVCEVQTEQLPAVPERCPRCGADPRPMLRGGYIEGSGSATGSEFADGVASAKRALRARFPILARVADDEEALQPF